MFGKKKKISVIDISGTISTRSGIRNHYKHYDTLNKLIKASEDKTVAAVLLRVNSPGGTAGASWELYKTVYDLQEVKPVYASISDVCCSGAYLAIVSCNQIYSSLMANVGSIGVFMQIPNVEELASKIGIFMNVIKSGPFKDIGNPFRPVTDEEQEYIQDIVDIDACLFRSIVERYRQIKEIDKNECFDGRFFTTQLAKEYNLIDEAGTFNDALKALKEKVGANKVVFESEPRGFAEKLLSKVSSGLQINLNILDLFKG